MKTQKRIKFGTTGDILLPRQGQELPTSLRVVQILFACGRGVRCGWNNLREIGTHPQSLPRKGGKLVAFTLAEVLITLAIKLMVLVKT